MPDPSDPHPPAPAPSLIARDRAGVARALRIIGRAVRGIGRSIMDVIFTTASVNHGVNPAARDQADQLAQSDRRQRTNRDYRP